MKRLIPETPRWSAMSKELDKLRVGADNAIHLGFVHGTTKDIDKYLREIEVAVKAARKILS